MSPPTDAPLVSVPLVGIVLVNYNGMAFLPACLESLTQQDYANCIPIIVDNASTDASREWLKQLGEPFVTVLLDKNTGVTGGNNAGILRALELGCDEVFFLNNDTVLNPDAVRILVEAREPNRMLIPRIYSMDLPKTVNTYFGDFDFLRGVSRQRFFGEADSPRTEQTAEGTLAGTCALMISASAIRKIGMMDDRYFLYFDDVDFVWRGVLAGYRVKYVPESCIFHRESSSSGAEPLGPLPLYYQTRNRLVFMSQHQRSRIKLFVFFLYFWSTRLVYLVRWTFKGDRRSLKAFWAAIGDYRAGKLGYAPPSRFAG